MNITYTIGTGLYLNARRFILQASQIKSPKRSCLRWGICGRGRLVRTRSAIGQVLVIEVRKSRCPATWARGEQEKGDKSQGQDARNEVSAHVQLLGEVSRVAQRLFHNKIASPFTTLAIPQKLIK
jgi:hypothetical protein